MANEFKIRKGLIVEGASGGTVVDVQGSQGQLFSVTDDLSGSIFAVSDISGVPILDINSNGVSYFDGKVGIGTEDPGKKLHVKESTTATYAAYIENSIAGGDYLAMVGDAGDNVFEFDSGGTGGEAIMKMYKDGVLKNLLDANGDSYFNGGDFGINTTDPLTKLQINNEGQGEFSGGNSSAAGRSHIMLRDEGGTSRTLMSGPSIVFQTPANTDGTNIWATSRILGSPAAAGSARGAISLQVRDNYDPLSDGTAWNWRTALTAINSGRVGIGTNSPGTKLDVDGVITATGGNSTQWNSAYNYTDGQNNSIQGKWYSGDPHNYVSGVQYYTYTKVAKLTGATTNASFEYYVKRDYNYPGTVKGSFTISTYSSASMSVQHDLSTGTGNMSPQVYIDNNRDIWIRFEGAAWYTTMRWRCIYNNGVTIYDGTTSQNTAPSNSALVNPGDSLKFDWNNVSNRYVNNNTFEVYAAKVTDDLIVSGKIGIGTTHPDALLEISGNAGADPGPITNPTTFRITDSGNAATGSGDMTNPWGKIEFYSEDVSSGGPSVQAQIASVYNSIYSNSSDLNFYTRASPGSSLSTRMTIDAGGGVGIGTTSPVGKLEVAGNSSISSVVAQYTNDADGAELVIRTARGTQAAPLKYSTGDSAGRLLFQAYTSSNQFEDAASIESVMESCCANAYGGLRFNYMPSTTPYTLTEGMRLNKDGEILIPGDVGIGNTNPSYKLDVSGTARAANFISGIASLNDSLVLASQNQHEKVWTATCNFTYTGAGTYYFNLAFGASGPFGFDLELVTGRNGFYRNFGKIKDSSYMYWETDGDFTHHAQGPLDVTSNFPGGEISLDAVPTAYLSATKTATSGNGSSPWSYFIKRYAINITGTGIGSDGVFKVILKTTGFGGSIIKFLNQQ